MTIPVLSNARLGYSWLDGVPGKIRFEDNRMVLGTDTRAFTLADTVGFGVKAQYRIPLIIESNKIFCLESTGTSLTNTTLCTRFGALVPPSMKFTPPSTSNEYVVIGSGDYQIRQSDGSYVQMTASNPNNVDLFRGASSYTTPSGSSLRLSDAFVGRSIANDGKIALYHTSTV